MVHRTLQRMLALLRISMRGQLLVLAVALVLMPLPMLSLAADASGMTSRLAMSALFGILAVGLSARASVRGVQGYDTMVSDLPGDAMQLAPRLVVQSTLVLAPFVAGWWGSMVLGSAAPLLGVPLIAIVLVASFVLPVPLLLVIGAVAGGDGRWMPSHALAMVRARPSQAILATGLPVGIVLVLLVPVLVAALVVAATIGGGAAVAVMAGASLSVPLLGCGARAAWGELGGDELLLDPVAADAASQDGVARLVEAYETDLVEGPSWDVAIGGGAAWGTWLRLNVELNVAVCVVWSDGPPPVLSLAEPSGTWRTPPALQASGVPLPLQLTAGDTYLQLQSQAPSGAQAVSVTLLLPAQEAA